MGRRSLWVYLSTIVGGALLFGVIVNELIPRDWIAGAIPIQISGEMHEHPTGWLQWVSSALLVILILHGVIQKYLKERQIKKLDLEKERDMKKERVGDTLNIHRYSVEGMTCKHCKASVENGLGQMELVENVLADPEHNLVTIKARRLTEATVKETIEKLGYQFKGRM